ncbi:MAG: hypothetical protein M1813_006275 [Trichoglossum hirsutum]|jgi:hypothetical protein|nr:MAG: hypothetical protein M1813_006275 [Trichoglossum hirsutum]
MPATAPTLHRTPYKYNPAVHDAELIDLYKQGWRLGSLTGRMNYKHREFYPPLTVVWVDERLRMISEIYRRDMLKEEGEEEEKKKKEKGKTKEREEKKEKNEDKDEDKPSELAEQMGRSVRRVH